MSDIEILTNEQIDGFEGIDDLNNGQNGVMEYVETMDQSEGDNGTNDKELEAIKARVKEMEEEGAKLKQLQFEVDKQLNLSNPDSLSMSLEDKIQADNRSIYVGNVDYSATTEDLQQHFHGCGSINRITIPVNKFDGHPKGFAYIEFADKDAVQMAMALDESLFKGRQIKTIPKRTNKPGMSMTNRAPRGSRGYRGMIRGVARGISRASSRGAYYGGYRAVRKSRGGPRRGFYMPY